MKPILFAPDAAEFNNNGLGVLADSPRCKVTEERNGPYELEMDYPIDGQHFSEITHSAIIYAVPADGKGPQPFRIYDITKPLDGLCTIYAEHISYQLAHIPVTPFGRCTSVASALQGLKNSAAETCPFTFWTDKTSTGSFEMKEPASIREMLGGTKGSILDTFGGGEYEWDGYTVKLYQHRGHDKGVTIRYGRNLTDLKQDEAIDSTVTGIYPFWSDDNSGTLVTLPEKVLHSENADNFPYVRTAVVDASSEFQEAPTETQLRDFGTRYITDNGIGVPKVSIDVSFAPLWQTEEYRNIANLERVNLCDTVTVVFEKLGVSATAKVVKTVYDVLNERYDTIELGDARTNLGKAVLDDISGSVLAIRQAIPSKSVIEGIVEAQTALITGGLGGYVKFVYNADGEPQELLFMDTDDVQTAVNVIRINRNGIGFSNDGYDPTKFVSAWTIDGRFSADFIATGHLLANFIQGGTLNMGGIDNGNGVIQVYDASGNLIGSWSKDGLIANSGGKLTSKNGNVYVDLDNNEIACSLLKNPTGTVGLDATTSKAFRMYNEGQEAYAITFVPTDSPNDLSHIYTAYGFRIGAYHSVNASGLDTFKAYLRLDNDSLLMATTKASLTFTTAGNVILGGNSATIPRDSYLGDVAHKIAYEQSSAKRYKHDIKPIEDKRLDPHNLLSLPVVQFVFDKDHEYEDMPGEVVPGIIAEDVERIYPNAAVHRNGKVESWDERRLIPGMLALIQEQDKKIKSLEARLARLEEMLT